MAKLAPMLDRLARHDDAAVKAGESAARLVLASGKRSRIEGEGDFEAISAAALGEDDVRDLLLQTGAGSRLDGLGSRPLDWTFRHESATYRVEARIDGRELRATIVRVRPGEPAVADRGPAVRGRAARSDTAARPVPGAAEEISVARRYDPRSDEEPPSQREASLGRGSESGRQATTRREQDRGPTAAARAPADEARPQPVGRGNVVTRPAAATTRGPVADLASRDTPFPPLAPVEGAAGPAAIPPARARSDADAWREVVLSNARGGSLFEGGARDRPTPEVPDIHDRPTFEPVLPLPPPPPPIDLDPVADRIASRRASLPPVFGFDEPPSGPLGEASDRPPPGNAPEAPPPRMRSSLPPMELPDASSVPPAPTERPVMGERLMRLVEQARRAGASDLHLAEGRPAVARIAGQLAPAGEPLDGRVLAAILLPTLTSAQRTALDRDGSVSFAATIGAEAGAPRCRLAISRQRTGLKASIRLLLGSLPSTGDLGLPDALVEATRHHQGLVLVSGPSGQGKSTTLAALVDHLNANTTHHVLTVEDPIEYLHPRKRAMLSQREIGAHTRGFSVALRSSLRQDPDVIVIGELRDVETVRTALSASETGHLVMGTLNTPSAPKTIDRLIDLFPPPEQPQVRATLAAALRLVASQRLLPRKEGGGRVAAFEILPGSLALANLIRDARTFQIPSLMQRGRAAGVVRLDDELADLVRRGVVERRDALAAADDPQELAASIDGRAGDAARPATTAASPAQAPAPAPAPAEGEERGGRALWQRAADMFRRGGG